VLVLSALVAATAIAVSSAGFSSIGSDRGVSVQTVDDKDAYLSLQYPEEPISKDSGEAVHFTVKNQFTEAVKITINYEVKQSGSITDQGSSESDGVVNPENIFSASVELTCASDTDYTVAFDVMAQSDSSSISVDTTDSRTVEVTCKSTDQTDTPTG